MYICSLIPAVTAAASAPGLRSRKRVKRASLVIRVAVVLTAIAVAVAPPGAASVERWYAKWLYPILQANITSLSNRSPIALFDVAIIVFVLIAIGIWIWSIRLARKKQAMRSLARGLAATLTLLAVVYLWFLGRVGIELCAAAARITLAFDASRITPEAVRALAEHAVDRANKHTCRRTRRRLSRDHRFAAALDRRVAPGGERARTAARRRSSRRRSGRCSRRSIAPRASAASSARSFSRRCSIPI